MASKIYNVPGLLKEEQFPFPQKIHELDKLLKILQKLTINSDQSLLPYLTVGNGTVKMFGTNLHLLT